MNFPRLCCFRRLPGLSPGYQGAVGAGINLKELRNMKTKEITERLNYLRGEIEAELTELQDLAPHIPPGDVLLMEWAGIPEQEAK